MAESVEVRGLTELLEKFEDLERALAHLTDPTQEAVDLLLDRVQFYPAEPPNSTYERTYNYRDSWEQDVSTSGQSTVGRLFSTISYGPYLKDEEEQAAIHEGRWPTLQEDVSSEEDNILALYDRYLEGVL